MYEKVPLNKAICIDLVDFFAIVIPSFLLSWLIFAIYSIVNETHLYGLGVEMILDAIIAWPNIALIFLSLVLILSLVHHMYFIRKQQTSIGGYIFAAKLLNTENKQPLSFTLLLFRSFAVILSPIFLMVGPLYAWWIEPHHRGGSDLLVGGVYMQKLVKNK